MIHWLQNGFNSAVVMCVRNCGDVFTHRRINLLRKKKTMFSLPHVHWDVHVGDVQLEGVPDTLDICSIYCDNVVMYAQIQL